MAAEKNTTELEELRRRLHSLCDGLRVVKMAVDTYDLSVEAAWAFEKLFDEASASAGWLCEESLKRGV